MLSHPPARTDRSPRSRSPKGAARTRAQRCASLATITGCLAATTIGFLAVGAAAAAAATSPRAHDPIGSTRSITAVRGGLLATGWAGDVDAGTRNVRVYAILDGAQTIATTVTSIALPGVTARHPVGPTPGFALTVPVPRGNHTVCIAVHSVGRGVDKVMSCVPTPLGTQLTSAQLAMHSPQGRMSRGHASATMAHFRGWAVDPDDLGRRALAVLYVDGVSTATQYTSNYAPTQAVPAGATLRSAIYFRVPVSTGTHEGCIWVVNVGIGSNTLLGCRTVDTRAGQPMTGAPPARIGARVVREAKKHIGQAYVWGASGPRTFDCSGLVMYSYAKFGFTTPRVSSDQFAAARLIPASRAVPGDLVFYHDSFGDVYHVGIYLSPALTVAAIDTAQGVNYQQVWDPTTATYGSFTHS